MIGLLTIVAIGFFLGMRHATDPDHVIAVSTIVTREHSVKRSALVGIAWGIGHTLTIMAVGGAIVLFRITLPPRVGLTMELAVAVMLIVLAIKNLGSLIPWSSERVGVVLNPSGADRAQYHSYADSVHEHHNSTTNPHTPAPQPTP